MNQKYLQGISSDMSNTKEAVFFEATPENISAFLSQHRGAQLSAIGTTDNKSFLTARMGYIDICPDQQYLAQKILPIYSKVQMGLLPVPPLKAVPQEVALKENSPKPDWNYLRWDGYSDRKYELIQRGEGLLELQQHEEKILLELQVRPYYNAGKLALLLVDWSTGEPEPWDDLTVNFGWPVKKDCAFVNVNHLGENILAWIEKNRLGTPTGRRQHSGFVSYPEYQFDAGRLRELDGDGYQQYSQIYEQANRPLHRHKKSNPER